MTRHRIFNWLIQSEKRKQLLIRFTQPMTVTQIAKREGWSLDSCLHLLWSFRTNGITHCLNPDTRHMRIHWLTRVGEAFQARLRRRLELDLIDHRLPDIPWDLYSAICYSHRSAVIKALRKPMQAAQIKRQALLQNAELRMSANNVRDVVRYLRSKGIVEKFRIKKRSHPRYELTDLGRSFQELLLGLHAR